MTPVPIHGVPPPTCRLRDLTSLPRLSKERFTPLVVSTATLALRTRWKSTIPLALLRAPFHGPRSPACQPRGLVWLSFQSTGRFTQLVAATTVLLCNCGSL